MSLNTNKHTQNKRNIVLIDIWRVINAKGGTEKVFCTMANELTQRGYQVTAICHDKTQGKPGFELSDQVCFINAYSKANFFEQKLFRMIRSFHFCSEKRLERKHFLTNLWKARNIKNAFDGWESIDAIISFQPETTYILKDILRLNKPIITMLHHAPEKFFSRKKYQFCKHAVESSAIIQVLTPEYVDTVKAIHPDTHIVCIPNAVPQYEQTAQLLEKRIINVARVTPQKRPDLLIEAFALLKDQYPEWVCEWYGELKINEDYSKYLIKLLKDKGLSNRFIFRGPSDKIPLKLNSSSIFAFPSEYEGLSLALLEAMSCGLPIVGCQDCPSVNTIIENGKNGMLVPPNPHACAAALARLIDNRELRLILGNNAKQTSIAYSPESVWQKWDELLKNLLDR